MLLSDRIVINDPDYGARIAAASGAQGGAYNPAAEHNVARVKNGELAGGVIFDQYTRAAIGIHIAGFDPNWVNRDLIWVVFDYCFNQLQVKKVIGLIAENNEQACSFAKSAGFTVETKVADVFPDSDLLVFSLYRKDCRWLNLKPRGPLRRNFEVSHG